MTHQLHRRWLLSGALAASTVLASLFGLVTNIASGMIPHGWGFARAPVAVWSIAGVLLVLTVFAAISVERLSRDGTAAESTGPQLYAARKPRPRPAIAVPGLRGDEVARRALTARLVSALIVDRPGAAGSTTALWGPGGFGKTTLAKLLVNRSDLQGHFGDGIFWLTLGETVHGPELAQKINDLAFMIAGERPALSDPAMAAVELGRVLGDGRVLLVIDDVWTGSQLEPFEAIRNRASLLVTTRNRETLPQDTVTIGVDAMERNEAEALLTLRLPPVSRSLMDGMLTTTGRWPTLLTLVNGAARADVRAGRTCDQALSDILFELRAHGPAALDVTDSDRRHAAVAKTVEVSLARLTEDHRARFLELAVFAEDVEIPGDVLERYWLATAGWSSFDTHRFCLVLADLALATQYRRSPDRLVVHDVLRAYIRQQEASRLPELHQMLVDAHRPLAMVDGALAWWSLPADEAYLWRWIPAHLAEAGLRAELLECLHAPRWLVNKLHIVGPAALEADLQLADDRITRALHRVISQNSHLLGRLDSVTSLAATLTCRVPDGPPLERIKKALVESLTPPYLSPAVALPDLPHRALGRVLGDRAGNVQVMAVFPDSGRLACGCSFGSVRIWDPKRGEALKCESGLDLVSVLVVAPDGNWVAGGGAAGFRINGKKLSPVGGVIVWDSETGAELQRFVGCPGAVQALAVSPLGTWVALAGGGMRDDANAGDVHVWDPRSGALIHTLKGHRGQVRGLAVSADGAWLVSAGVDGTVRVWDPVTGVVRHVLPGGVKNALYAPLAIPSTDEWLASAGLKGTIRVWDPVGGAEICTLVGRASALVALASAPDGSWLASADIDGVVRVWDPLSGVLIYEFEDCPSRVFALAAAADGSWLAAGDDDGLVHIWDPRSGERLETLVGHPSTVTVLAVAPDSSWFASAAGLAAGGDLRIWDPDSWRSQKRPDNDPVVQKRTVFRLTAPVGGEWFATSGKDGEVWIHDSTSASVRRKLPTPWQHNGALAAAPNGAWLAAAEAIGDRLWWWNADTWAVRHAMVTDLGMAESLAAPPDGSWLAIGFNSSGNVIIMDTATGAELHRMTGLEGTVWKMAVSPDGAWLASICASHAHGADEIRVWDVSTGAERSRLSPEQGGLRELAVSPDGAWLASAGTDGSICIWDPRSGSRRHKLLMCHAGRVNVLTAALDGRWLASAGADGSICVWNPRSGLKQHVLSGHTGAVHALTTSPDGLCLASAGEDGSVRIWDAVDWRSITSLRLDCTVRDVRWLHRKLVLRGDQGLYQLQVNL